VGELHVSRWCWNLAVAVLQRWTVDCRAVQAVCRQRASWLPRLARLSHHGEVKDLAARRRTARRPSLVPICRRRRHRVLPAASVDQRVHLTAVLVRRTFCTVCGHCETEKLAVKQKQALATTFVLNKSLVQPIRLYLVHEKRRKKQISVVFLTFLDPNSTTSVFTAVVYVNLV